MKTYLTGPLSGCKDFLTVSGCRTSGRMTLSRMSHLGGTEEEGEVAERSWFPSLIGAATLRQSTDSYRHGVGHAAAGGIVIVNGFPS
ncbi:MAG TPA: hypothetical protein VH643_16735 [Gemmataceae bacterium]|jgi:hypothetical protein